MDLNLKRTQPGVVLIQDDDVVLTFATMKPDGSGEVWINGPRPHNGHPIEVFRQVARDHPEVFVTRIREGMGHLDGALESFLHNGGDLSEAKTEADAILGLIKLLQEQSMEKRT